MLEGLPAVDWLRRHATAALLTAAACAPFAPLGGEAVLASAEAAAASPSAVAAGVVAAAAGAEVPWCRVTHWPPVAVGAPPPGALDEVRACALFACGEGAAAGHRWCGAGADGRPWRRGRRRSGGLDEQRGGGGRIGGRRGGCRRSWRRVVGELGRYRWRSAGGWRVAGRRGVRARRCRTRHRPGGGQPATAQSLGGAPAEVQARCTGRAAPAPRRSSCGCWSGGGTRWMRGPWPRRRRRRGAAPRHGRPSRPRPSAGRFGPHEPSLVHATWFGPLAARRPTLLTPLKYRCSCSASIAGPIITPRISRCAVL